MLLLTIQEESATHTSVFDWFLYIIAIIAVAIAYQYLFSGRQTPIKKFNNTQTTSTNNTMSTSTSTSNTSSTASSPSRTFTLAELNEFNGGDPSKPLYLGCNGMVFDVSSARGFYGPGAAYGVFAGKDASRGLAKMEIEYNTADISDLSLSQKQTLREWSDKFQTKYPIVGTLRDTTQPNSGTQPAAL